MTVKKPLLMCLAVMLLVCPAVNADMFYTEKEVQALLFPDGKVVSQPLIVDKSLLKEIKKQTSMRLRPEKLSAWKVLQHGEPAGWLFVTDVLGKHEDIRFAVAISPTGSVKGVEVMEYRETHGGEVREKSWQSQFDGKKLGDGMRLGRDIDNISGATLSCRHLTDAIHALLIVHNRLLKAG